MDEDGVYDPIMADYNMRFGQDPENAKDLHRKLTEADDLSEVLAWREERSVTKNLTLYYDRMMLLLDPTPLARSLARKTFDVVNFPDGRFAVQFEGTSLPPSKHAYSYQRFRQHTCERHQHH